MLKHEHQLSLAGELRDTLKLAGPIILAQVGHMSMGIVDTLVAGRISTEALAGLGLAGNFFWTFTHVGVACMFALDTFFSQSIGARDERALARYFSQAFWLCGILMVVAFAVVLAGANIYLNLAPPSPTKQAFAAYVYNIVWCIPSLFLFFLLQRYWQARHRVLAFMLMILGANVLNLLACFAFGLGWWGFPRLEVQGLAWATIISRYAMLVAALVYTWWRLKPASVRMPLIDKPVQRDFFKLGLPAAGHAALEVGTFAVVTFIIGLLGPVPLAAHHLCLMMAAFTFMFPVGLSSAAAVRVGIFVGAGQPERARLAGWLCIWLAVALMGTFSAGYLAMPSVLLGWFSQDAAVIEVGVKLLLLAALFQIADGVQVTVTGALRGLGNTRAALIANLIGHYPIGLAFGLVLAFPLAMGAVGLWTGLAVGLAAVAILLLIMWWKMTRNLSAIRRLQPSERKLILLPVMLAMVAGAGDEFTLNETQEQITIGSSTLEAVVRKRGYVTGISGGTFLDKQSGFRDAGFGLDIVDWIMEPGSDEAYREQLPGDLAYKFNNSYHGKTPKRSLEGPQICTQAKQLSPQVIRGQDFVAINTRYQYHLAAPGKKTGSTWEQTIVFPAGKRYFISSDRINAVNSSEAMFLRLDMPGHIRHQRGDTFSEVYLSYAGRIPASEFFNDFPPDAKFNYRRDTNKMPERFIRAYRLRDPKTGREGPWLAGMTLKPAAVYEAWCHQRGYVCMIEEFGGRPIRAGQSFSAAFIVGFFDSIEEMERVYDRYAGYSGLQVTENGWALTPRFAWETATPESQGMSSHKLEALKDSLAKRKTKALLVVRNDKIVYEWYAPGHSATKPHYTASMAKAIVGGLSLGVAITDGRIALDDPAAKYIPQWKADARKSKITIRHLGSHTSGLEDAEANDLPHEKLTGWKGDFWKRRDESFTISRDQTPAIFNPGEQFAYSNPGIAMLTYCVTASLQQDIRTVLRDRIMRPMGVPDGEWSVGYGKTSTVDGLPLVASWGGGGYTARAVASVGRLMLRQGNWDSQQLLSKEAVRDITSDAGLPGECGMGWWTNARRRYPKLPADAFWGAGAGDQVVLVVPSLNLIAVRNGETLEAPPKDPTLDVFALYHDARTRILFEPLVDAITGK